jgi:signal transduction histidine kinase
MNRDERRLLLYLSLLVAALLVAAGFVLRSFVAQTLAGDAKVQLAFLDLALRDRSRYLAETLQPERANDRWPHNLADILTKNHADYNRDIFLQVFTTEGSLVAASANTPPQMELSPRARREGLQRLNWLTDDIINADGKLHRIVTYPIFLGDPTLPETKVHGFSQAGLPMPDSRRALRQFTWVMFGTLAGFGVLFVIALRAAVAAATQRLQREMAVVQSSQHRFIGDAAHELGTPLAILQGEMDIALRRERSAEEYRLALLSCREEIERLSRLSENLLALATADAGENLLHYAPMDAAVLAQRVHQRFLRVAEDKGVQFYCHAIPPIAAIADAIALEQILSNLISNALRHTPSGDVVTLAASVNSTQLVFTVTDTGEGIPAHHLPRLFDRFHRVDKPRARALGGAGLGLAIVKTLVEAHRGTITVKSEVGKGSTFTCEIPLAPPA